MSKLPDFASGVPGSASPAGSESVPVNQKTNMRSGAGTLAPRSKVSDQARKDAQSGFHSDTPPSSPRYGAMWKSATVKLPDHAS
jgi:hypothetical protein